jgi:hypothetical protein
MQPFEEDTSFKPVASLMEKENQRENDRILLDTIATSPISKPFSLRASTPTTVIPNITPVRSMGNDDDPRRWEPNATMEEEGDTTSAFGLLDFGKLSLQEHISRSVVSDASCLPTESSDAINAAPTMTDLERRIALAMEQFANRNISSKLGETWMNCSKHTSGQVAMAQLLEAAISDILDLQDVSHERRAVPVDVTAALNPVTISSSVQNEEKMLVSSTHEATIRQLTMQKQHIIANMKKKKVLLDDAERKLAIAERELQQVSEERNALRLQLESVTESRDSLKNKFRNQQEIVKDTKNGMLELKQRLQKTEQMRALENELLDNFRKLAIHTG